MKFKILLLKLSTIFIGITVLTFLTLVIPDEIDIKNVGRYLPMIITIYISSIPFFLSLFETFKLLNYINRKKVFSELTLKALNHIKHYAVVFGILHAVQIPLLYYLSNRDDAPGILAIGLILTFSPIIIALITSILQKIIKDVINV